MTAAASAWKALSDQTKTSFNAAFKPFCDLINKEIQETNHKDDNISGRLEVGRKGRMCSATSPTSPACLLCPGAAPECAVMGCGGLGMQG